MFHQMNKVNLSDITDKAFLESSIFYEAITHRSAGGSHNERLEYLGDAVLDLVIADYLYFKFPDLNEGDLSRIRAHLVRKETLASIASAINLGKVLILGPGEIKSGGQRRETILANTLEALIGAIYILRGLDEAKRFVYKLFESYLKSIPAPERLKDPKSQLQELLQSRNIPLATYSVIKQEGESHARIFKSRCYIESLNIETTAWGSSKRKAEQESARKALKGLLESGAQ
jgi:ribonuclease-3